MRYALLLSAVACVAMPIVGCSALDDLARTMTGRPVGLERADQIAQGDLELRAFVIAASWHALQEQGVRLVEQPDTPEGLREAIREADAAGAPVIAALMQAAETYGALAGQPRASGEEAVRLRIALADGERAFDAMSSLVVIQAGAQ